MQRFNTGAKMHIVLLAVPIILRHIMQRFNTGAKLYQSLFLSTKVNLLNKMKKV
jgi:hypothetical protein